MGTVSITGDCHGDYRRFTQRNYPVQKEMTHDDIVIVCGDFGIWNDDPSERFNLNELSNRNFTTLFCDGNHECLHKDTEVLTSSGWINIQNVVEAHNQYEVASVDLNTHQIYFEQPVGVVKKFSEVMIETANSNFKQCVTPNHDMVVQNQKMPAHIVASQTFREKDFKVDVLPFNASVVTLQTELIELLTAIVMDATIVDYSKSNPNSRKMRIQFHLKKQKKVDYIKTLLHKCKIPYTARQGNLDDTLICVYSDAARTLYAMLESSKSIPKQWQYLTLAQFEALLHALQITDATKVNEVTVWRTTNYDDVSVISAAAMLNGYDISVDTQGKSGYTDKCKVQYRVTIAKQKQLLHYMKYNTIQYNDFAYCLTMPHGTLITRYHSCPVVTGNCFDRLCTEEYLKYMKGEDITGADQGEFPLVDMYGGKVQKIRDNVYHLLRGEVYTIHGKKFFVFGGASSHDISEGILDRANYKSDDEFYEAAYLWRKTRVMYRINHVSWWKEELPSEDEMRHGLEQLAKHDFKVDYIISHCAPTSIHCLMGYDSPDIATNYLQQIAEKTQFEKWFFGHYHGDRNINPEYILMYYSIYPLIDTERERWSAFGTIEEDEPGH